MQIEAVDLFCGVGGLTAGLLKSGIKVKAGYDIESACQYGYEHNNQVKFVLKDVAQVDANEVDACYSQGVIRLLAGCAPCQPFSTYNNGRDTTTDEKYPLLHHFSRLIEGVLPELVTMENVPSVIKHQVYHNFVSKLELLGYQVFAQNVECVWYGVPQKRKRHVLMASRIGSVQLVPPTHTKPVTVREAIGNLPPIKAGERHINDPLHYSAKLSELNMRRIKASKQGGTWRDWSDDLIADCHKKSSGKTFASVYGRMSWDEPAPTMTTLCTGFGNGRFGHPEQDRAISLREAAVFQTFPCDYQFAPSINKTAISKMIGNAVPVRLGEIIGLSFLKALG